MKLIGLARLGRDAELVPTKSGDSMLRLSLAYNFGRLDDRQTQWVDASFFGKRAEASAKYLTKGAQIYVELSNVHIKTYEKKDGSTGVTLSGIVAEFQRAGEGYAQSQPEQKPNYKPAPKAHEQPQNQYDDFDDDIPF